MKPFLIASLSVLAIGTASVQAEGMVQGFYAGLMGGVSYTPSVTFSAFDPTFSTITKGTVDYNIAGGAALQLGYRCDHFRGELEILGNFNPIDKININGAIIRKKTKNYYQNITLRGDTVLGAGLVNLIFDFNSEQPPGHFSPYAGLGVGYAHIASDLRFYFNGNKVGDALNISSTHPIGQGIIGISYALDNFTMIALDGRALMTSKPKNSDDSYKVGMINILFNVAFG